MKLLQVCNKPPYPPRDGGSMAMFNLAEALTRLGHRITVLTMVTKKHRLTYEQHIVYAAMMEVHTVHVDTSPGRFKLLFNLLFSAWPYTATRFISHAFEIELIRMLENTTFDVIQLEGLYLTPYIKAIKARSNARTVLRAHNVEHEIWERMAAAEKNFLKRWYYSVLAKRVKSMEYDAMNTYDLLVPITGRDQDKFNSMGNIRPSHVCPAGIDIMKDTEEKDSVSGDKGIYSLYFLGSLDWIPNQEGLIWFVSHVFPMLRLQYPDIRLHVAGRNAPPSLIKRIDLPGIVFRGEIDDSRKFAKEHTVMVAPCFSGGGMRLKIVEAMSLGKAVVTTTIGAEGLTVTHGENILIADNVRQFYQHIDQLMKYPDICNEIGLKALQFVKDHFNNLDIAASLAGFYNQQLK